MNRPIAWLRCCAYAFATVAFFIFVCHILLQSAIVTRLDRVDADIKFHISVEMSRPEEYVEPKVNTMCTEAKEVYLLVLINSAPKNFFLRWTIRKSWGAVREYKGYNVRLAFVLGQLPEEDQRTKSLIEKESVRTNDIIFGDFYDTYYNLTAKTLYGMAWVRQYCSNAQYIVKGDDDVLIIPQNIIDYIQDLPKDKSEDLYEGACQVSHSPMRGADNKWYISEVDYPNSTYPPYQLGVTVIHSYKALVSLYDACHRVPDMLDVPLTFPFDDVFIGICAQLTDIEVTCNQHIIVYKDDDLQKFLKSRRPNCLMKTTLAVHGLNRRKIVLRRWRMINRMKEAQLDNCFFNYTTSAT